MRPVRSRREMAHLVLEQAFQMLADNLRGLRIDDALFVPPGGYRSALGPLKHIAGWSHVYRSYTFDPDPRHWAQIDWPRGLRETVVPGQRWLELVDQAGTAKVDLSAAIEEALPSIAWMDAFLSRAWAWHEMIGSHRDLHPTN